MSGKKTRAEWLKRVGDLPAVPGVYVMKDATGAVIYVGKAKNLKNRVRQYFQEGTHDYRAFVRILSGILADIETRIARTEKEALLLEREMIRRHEPRFNIIWRDDKQYLCLRIDLEHPYPWVQVVRQVKEDGARYFGPFHSASAARQTLQVVNRHFQLRTCRDSVLNNRKRPCLEYQIGRCPAPCVYDVDKDKYREGVSDVLMFLEGKGQELAKRLEERMWAASERTDYEVAAHYRDQLRAVSKTLSRQKVAFPNLVDQDVFGLYREGEDVGLAIVEVRSGRVENIVTRLFEGMAGDDPEVLTSAILQRYDLLEDKTAGPLGLSPPKELVVPFRFEDAEDLSELLTDRRGRKVSVLFPQRGDRVSLLELAQENAEHGFHEQRRKSGAFEKMLENLQKRLHLARLPVRIECFDISNLGSDHIVASRVVFVGGQPQKKLYRRYKIRNPDGQDDFASMYEVLSRRFKRGLEENDLPSLVVVDGGKGQLNVARAVFKDLGVESVDLVGLAKSRRKDASDDAPTERSPERVFRLGARDPIVLRQNSAELLLLARIRDEAHRFAITFQRGLKRKAQTRSALDELPGIGPAKKRALLSHLGSLRRVKEARVEELAQVPGIGKKGAERLWALLHPGDAPVDLGEAPSVPPSGPTNGTNGAPIG